MKSKFKLLDPSETIEEILYKDPLVTNQLWRCNRLLVILVQAGYNLMKTFCNLYRIQFHFERAQKDLH